MAPSGPLDRLPALATTGVGCLPFTHAREAARHAARAYELPFCPQLPRVDGDMVREWLGRDPQRCGWSPDRDRRRPAAWDAFVALMAAQPPRHRVVKLQVTGPITLAAALERATGRLGRGPEMVVLARETTRWLAVSVIEQVGRLRALGLDVLVVADEPALAHARLADHDVTVWDPLRDSGAAAWGLHVCGAVPWRIVERAEPDVLSLDLEHHWRAPAGRPILARLVRGGGLIGWGVLDPVTTDGPMSAAGGAAAAVGSLGLPPALVARHSLLTPSCGSGRLTPDRERFAAASLDAAARATRSAVRALPGGSPASRPGIRA